MEQGGLYLILIILFIETGLFFGFFLPGDPLLFISGIIIANTTDVSYPFDVELLNLLFWGVLFIISTILGNFVGYWTGKKFGHRFTNKEKKSWLIKPKHIEGAQQFYKKRGGFAVLMARFVPIARTFIPIIGGIVGMNIRHFATYNVLGAILWVGTLTSLGYVLGENEWVKNNLEWTLLGIVLVVTAPVIVKMFVKKSKTVESED